MGGGSLDAIPVVNTTLSGFGIDIEILQIVVEVNRASTQISPKERCMSCENSCHVNAPLLGKGQGNTGEPFVEVGYDRFFLLVADKLQDP